MESQQNGIELVTRPGMQDREEEESRSEYQEHHRQKQKDSFGNPPVKFILGASSTAAAPADSTSDHAQSIPGMLVIMKFHKKVRWSNWLNHNAFSGK